MAILLGLISSLTASIQLHVTMLNVHGEYLRKRMNIMKMLSVSTSQKIVLKRLNKKPARPRRFWVRPGRTSARLDNFASQTVVPEEWRDRLEELILLGDAHALRRALSYFHRFCVYVWTGENDSNTLRVDENFFKNGEKNFRF